MSSTRYIGIGSFVFGLLGILSNFVYGIAEETMLEDGHDSLYDQMSVIYKPFINPIYELFNSIFSGYVPAPIAILVGMAPFVGFALVTCFSFRFLWRTMRTVWPARYSVDPSFLNNLRDSGIARNIRKILLLLLVALVIASGVSFCSVDRSCDRYLQSRYRNPSDRSWALVFYCAGKSENNLHISLAPTGEYPPGKGNALVLDGYKGPYTSRWADEMKKHITPSEDDAYVVPDAPVWNSDTAITLTIPKGARVVFKNSSVAGVKVTFRQR